MAQRMPIGPTGVGPKIEDGVLRKPSRLAPGSERN